MKNLIIAVVVLVVIGIGGYIVLRNTSNEVAVDGTQLSQNDTFDTGEVNQENTDEQEADDSKTVIGSSRENNDITAYHYGDGETELMFIGGIHGGYSWNTVLVAYQLMDYLEANPEVIPENVRVTVVPVMNPDGLEKVVGTTTRFVARDVPTSQSETVPGRFNADNVDLNRNFDCDWQSEGTWQKQTVSGGDEVFSEPEARAIRDYVQNQKPEAIVTWYSALGGVFSSNCHSGVLADTLDLTKLYANASGYKAYEEFGFYDITGDMVNWFAKEKIPAISVLLSTHDDVEWDKNRAGVEAMFEKYAQ